MLVGNKDAKWKVTVSSNTPAKLVPVLGHEVALPLHGSSLNPGYRQETGAGFVSVHCGCGSVSLGQEPPPPARL